MNAGFFNFLVYLRPRYQNYKKKHIGESIMSYNGLRSMFFDNAANPDEEDYNVAPPSVNDENNESRNGDQSSARFGLQKGAHPSSCRSASSGGSQAGKSVRFSQISQVENDSKASVIRGCSSVEEKCEEC